MEQARSQVQLSGQRDGSLRPYSRFSRQEQLLFYQVTPQLYSRVCGLVFRVLGYRSGGPGSIPGTTRKKNTTFRKSQVQRWKTPILQGPLERVNLNLATNPADYMTPTPHLMTETFSV
jgi:hypothetical protein